MQETAYASLLKKTRTELHLQVAGIIEEQFSEAVERHPQMLAFHYGEAGVADKAIPYWMLACKASLESYANEEAIVQADAALKILSKTPESMQRGSTEITLRMMRGRALVATLGYSNTIVEQNFAAALALCEQIGDPPPELFQLLVGLWMNFFISGELEHSSALARRLLRIAEKEGSAPKVVQAHYCLGFTLYSQGDYARAREELEASIAAEVPGEDYTSESASGDDTRTHSRSALAHVLWHLGYLQKSLELAEEAFELARQTGHPYAMIFTAFMKTFLHMLREEPEQVDTYSVDIIKLSEDHAFTFWLALGKFFRAWAMYGGGRNASEDQARTRLDTMTTSYEDFLATGANVMRAPLTLEIIASRAAVGEFDDLEEQLDQLEKKLIDANELQFIHDLTRYRGLISRARGENSAAEEFFTAAQTSAREAGSVSLSLRAAAELAALQAEEGNEQIANELLESAYGELPERDEGQVESG